MNSSEADKPKYVCVAIDMRMLVYLFLWYGFVDFTWML